VLVDHKYVTSLERVPNLTQVVYRHMFRPWLLASYSSIGVKKENLGTCDSLHLMNNVRNVFTPSPWLK
jgi:hypothetical protein